MASSVFSSGVGFFPDHNWYCQPRRESVPITPDTASAKASSSTATRFGSFVADSTSANSGALGTRFGADLHVVYAPDLAHGDPPATDAMRWIQVVARRDPMGPATEVDNSRRANPFYIYGGLTSVNGRLLVNFQDTPQYGIQIVSGPGPDAAGTADDEPTLGEHLFRAETFLVRDTGRCDRSGRGIVEVYGGIRWGWHAVELKL